ncbi:SDR family oxidoreductase [Thermodesulfobacteriota bacterium]
MDPNMVLVTGATGYVGGRLVSRLLTEGYQVRAMARSRQKLRGRPWGGHSRLEVARVDLQAKDITPLEKAINGCSAAFYLVHSMNPEHLEFAGADRNAAQNFVRAAETTGLKRIIYLGGLGQDSPDLSQHLRSRAEVGHILQSGSVPTTILRSAIILGSGSASFEMLRYLAERMPLMLLPGNVLNTEIQPICIRNVLNYLEGCLDSEETTGGSYDIGGPDILTYRQLFEIYADETGLRKPLFVAPGFLPHSDFGRKLGIGMAKLVLPISPAIADPLLQGVVNRAVVEDNRITRLIPQNLMTCREAIRRAIQKDSLQIVETRWTDAGGLKPPEWAQVGDAPYAGGTLLQGGFKVTLAESPEKVWPIISRIGGQNGWYYGDLLWQVRGWMDNMVGGVGLRRGRRHPEKLLVGDALDFWRVLRVNPPFRLILLAEMKLPGEAILDFELEESQPGQTELRLSTRFRSRGLYGLFYWYVLLPFHNLLFGGMLKAVSRKGGKPAMGAPQKFKPGPISV